MRPINPLLFVPGLLFWTLVGVGLATDNETLLGVAVSLALVSVVVGLVAKARIANAARKEIARVWFEGEPALAKVLCLSAAGGGQNDHPNVNLDLEVTPVGKPSFSARASALISNLAIPRVQPDCMLRVRFDPKDRTKIAIDETLLYLKYSR